MSTLGSDVHLWFRITATLADPEVDALVSRLSLEERARAARFVFARDRRDFAAAHALVRDMLSMHDDRPPAEWTFEAADQGKPRLPLSQAGAPPLAFNLSHTRGLVACGVARGVDLGVDVETIDPALDRRDIAARFFSPAENAGLAACPAHERPARFIELWTLKEAYVKAIGRGLMESLDAFGFSWDGAQGIRFDAPPGATPAQWTFALFAPTAHQRLAVAIRADDSRPRAIIARDFHGARMLEALRAT